MPKYIIPTLLFFIVACANQNNENSRFTGKQIQSLHLDSTTVLTINANSVEDIDLNPFLKEQNFDFGSLVKEIKLIPLETTNESLLGGIYEVLVTDSFIYIRDNYKGEGIVIFNGEGKFVKRLSYGGGPGELFRLSDIAYDTEKNELIAYQHPFLYYYTHSGQFIQRLRLPFGFYNFTVIPDGYVFKALDGQGNEHLGLWKDYTLWVTDKSFKLKSVGLPAPGIVGFGGYHYLYNNNLTVTATQKFTDTVYQYINNTNQLNARYVLNYSKKKLPEIYLHGSLAEFNNAILQNDYYFYIGEYFETESHNAFFLRNRHIGLNTVIYRDKESGNLIGGTGADFNVNELPSGGFPIATSGNWFISCHFPNKNDSLLSNSSILSNDDKEKIKGLIDDDNPVLVFFQLKDF
jgi:hypothetical protein